MISFRSSALQTQTFLRSAFRTGSSVLCGVVALGCAEGDAIPPIIAAGTGGGGSGGIADAGLGGSGGGTAGAAGSGGSGGGTTYEPTVEYTFDDGPEDFRIIYVCPVSGSCMTADIAPTSASTDAGTGDAGSAPSSDFVTFAYDPAGGEPPPSLRVELDFGAAGQLAVLARNIDSTDLTGKILSARVRLEAQNVGAIVGKMYVKTGETYKYADSGEQSLTPGAWSTLTYVADDVPAYIDNANAGTYDITDVREFGIEFSATVAPFAAAAIHVDNFAY